MMVAHSSSHATPVLLSLALLLASPAAADDVGAPGPEHRRLDALVGEWDVALEIPIGGGRTARGEATCRAEWTLDGRFVRLEYASAFGGRPLTVLRYVGFDRARGKVVETHFESTHTDVMRLEGGFSEDGRAIACEGTGVEPSAGQVTGVRTVTTLDGPDRFTLAMTYLDAGGNDARTVKLSHARRAAAARAGGPRVRLVARDLDAAAAHWARILGEPGRRVDARRHEFERHPIALVVSESAEPARVEIEVAEAPGGAREIVDPFGNSVRFVAGPEPR
jgi:hypothetical protein